MNRNLHFTLLTLICLTTSALAGDYRYVSPDQFKNWLENGKKMAIIDIQPAAEYQQRHFAGAIETNAFPAKSDAERQRLDKTLPQLAKTADDVVVVCPRGGGGAKGTYDYLKSRGIEEKRLFILEKGMQGWPHQSLTVSGK